jgi:hypothetical protein
VAAAVAVLRATRTENRTDEAVDPVADAGSGPTVNSLPALHLRRLHASRRASDGTDGARRQRDTFQGEGEARRRELMPLDGRRAYRTMCNSCGGLKRGAGDKSARVAEI